MYGLALLSEALLQEHFVAAQKEWRGLRLMTTRKAEGKEFDEVAIYQGAFPGCVLMANADVRRDVQSRFSASL